MGRRVPWPRPLAVGGGAKVQGGGSRRDGGRRSGHRRRSRNLHQFRQVQRRQLSPRRARPQLPTVGQLGPEGSSHGAERRVPLLPPAASLGRQLRPPRRQVHPTARLHRLHPRQPPQCSRRQMRRLHRQRVHQQPSTLRVAAASLCVVEHRPLGQPAANLGPQGQQMRARGRAAQKRHRQRCSQPRQLCLHRRTPHLRRGTSQAEVASLHVATRKPLGRALQVPVPTPTERAAQLLGRMQLGMYRWAPAAARMLAPVMTDPPSLRTSCRPCRSLVSLSRRLCKWDSCQPRRPAA
mmetsp:Transcript_12892/g.40506  ORF Transcript_12892/g.40506 Transcript_12892/m.40506 type:complete len:294 (+) Transcript_12892:2163-3044(+)